MDEDVYKEYHTECAKHITFKQYKKICKYKKILIEIDYNLDCLKRTLIIINAKTIEELENKINSEYEKYSFWKNEYENYLQKNNLLNFYDGSIFKSNEIYNFLNGIRTEMYYV